MRERKKRVRGREKRDIEEENERKKMREKKKGWKNEMGFSLEGI